MFVPPSFQLDAKALLQDLGAVLDAPFPAPREADTAVEQAQSEGLTYLGLLERAASMVAGEQRRVMAVQVGLANAEPGPFEDAADAEYAEWSACAEIAAVLQVACRTAEGRVDEARTLYERLPLTLARLRSGQLTVSKAVVLLEETRNVDAPECARVERIVLANMAGTRSNFKRRVRGAVQRVDPEAVVRKREAARKEVDVVTFEAEDGLHALNALIPPEASAAAWTAINEHAKALKVPGDQRSAGQLRADALVDLLVNRPDGTPRVVWHVQVIVPVGTLLGISDEDAHIPGHGPIPADVARDIAADTAWQRLLTDPDTGALLDANPDRYRPGNPLDRFIKIRDQHCRWPGCRRAAKYCDVDHTIPHGKPGGLTIRQNLACFCRRHHQIKQLPGWQVTQGDHGELTFTTPTGRSYRTRPPNPDGTEPPDEVL